MSFIMKGDYSERRFFSQNPFVRICNMHKSDQHFFGDNREISNSAVKGVPFLPIFVGTYEGTIFSEHGSELNDMKSPQGQKSRNSRYPYTGFKNLLTQAEKVYVHFPDFWACPQKIRGSIDAQNCLAP